MKAVLRVCMPLLTLLLAVACGGDEDSPEAGEGPDLGGDTGGECTDADGDGFGLHCAQGDDCDDQDDTVFEDCGACTDPEEGCECEVDAPAIECKLTAEQIAADSLLCETGMRYCREGLWTACISVASFD